jgi:hypothetical protein
MADASQDPGRSLAAESDTTDTEMGQRWQDQLAALDARLERLLQEERTQEARQQHAGMEW